MRPRELHDKRQLMDQEAHAVNCLIFFNQLLFFENPEIYHSKMSFLIKSTVFFDAVIWSDWCNFLYSKARVLYQNLANGKLDFAPFFTSEVSGDGKVRAY